MKGWGRVDTSTRGSVYIPRLDCMRGRVCPPALESPSTPAIRSPLYARLEGS